MMPLSTAHFHIIIKHLYPFPLLGSNVGRYDNARQIIRNLVIPQDFLYIGSI